MIELNSRTLDVKFNDVIYKMKFPTVKEMRKHQKSYEETEDQIGLMIDFFVSLGMKKEIVEELEMFQLEMLMNELVKPKK